MPHTLIVTACISNVNSQRQTIDVCTSHIMLKRVQTSRNTAECECECLPQPTADLCRHSQDVFIESAAMMQIIWY